MRLSLGLGAFVLALACPPAVSAVTIAVGWDNAFVVRADGTVWAWGRNGSGELATGHPGPRIVPGPVPGLNGIVAVSAGNAFGMALDGAGRVFTWGANDLFQLGDGTNHTRSAPAALPGLCEAVSVAAAEASAAVVCRDGTVRTWGDNHFGQLGDGTTESRTSPVAVHGEGGANTLQGMSAVVGGGHHFVALAQDGTVWAWGQNDIAQLGQGSAGPARALPVQVRDAKGTGILSGIAALAMSLGNFTLALDRDGCLWGWGANKHGQLGIGTTANPLPLPARVKDPSGVHELRRVTAIAAGRWHSLAVLADGTLLGWGMNAHGEDGDGTDSTRGLPVPVQASLGHRFTVRVAEIAGGPYCSFAAEPDGTLWAWGWNAAGQLGDGTFNDHFWPTRLTAKGASPAAGKR